MPKGETYLSRGASRPQLRVPDPEARRVRAENQRRQAAAKQLRSTWGGYARVMA